MPESNATPAPLTMSAEVERAVRAFYGTLGDGRGVGRSLLAEVDATRAKLAEAEAKLARYDAPVGGLGVFAEALAERERLQYEPHLRREMRRASEAEAKLTAAESRVAALSTAMRNWLAAGRCPGIELANGHYSGCNAEYTGAHDCPTCGEWRVLLESAALSPSQDAKEARDA